MQDFFEEVENHVLHYLHKICDDQKLAKVALFQLALTRKIIPEYLWLGNSFFTHMSVFGTINKTDGVMPLHFDKIDIISCIFHLGKITKGGDTQHFDGDKSEDPGEKVLSVPSRHGTLQFFF